MKSITYKKFGKADVLKLDEKPIPKIKDNQVLVKQKATSVNPIDYKLRQGEGKPFTFFILPMIPGGDVSGVVEEVGVGVNEFAIDDEVFGLTPAVKGGTYAEYVAVKADNLVVKPKSLSFDEAAGIPLAGLTAYQSLYDKGGIERNMHVYINGCTGGVGHYAVQIAKAYDCKVTGTCSHKNIDFAKQIGVDNAIAYDTEDPLSEGVTYDLFFDVSSNYTFGKVKHLLGKNARYVNLLPSFSIYTSALFNSRIKPSWVSPGKDDMKELRALIEKGMLRSFIDKAFSLEEAVQAHRYCEKESVRGKVIISMKE